MRQIKGKSGGRPEVGEDVADGPRRLLDGLVPHALQRLGRSLIRSARRAPAPPVHSGSAAALGFLGSAVLYGLVLGGHLAGSGESIASTFGFAFGDLELTGNNETSEIDIIQALSLDGGTSLVTLDIAAARDAINALPWVEDAQLRKIYPGTLSVALQERQPFGLWQHGSSVSIIEADGSVVAPLENGKFATLPLFVGLGADTHADAVFAVASLVPRIADQIRAFVRVADRRWDLRLRNGITVSLPERGVGEALELLARLDRDHAVLSRDIRSVDLRLKDRVSVGLSDAAAERLAETAGKPITLHARMEQSL